MSTSGEVHVRVDKILKHVNQQVISRGTRAVNAIRNAELQVLKGQRSGKVYKVPGTYGKSKTEATKKLAGEYAHKLRYGQLYRASAPGEPPARRTGNLRLRWTPKLVSSSSGKSVTIKAVLESRSPYAGYLQNGTSKMAPRPFVDEITEKALPEIAQIYGESYT